MTSSSPAASDLRDPYNCCAGPGNVMKDQESMRWRSGWLLGTLLVSAASVGCSAAGVPAPGPDGVPAAVDDGPAPAPGGGNLIKNGTFDDGTSLPWTTSFSAPADGKASIEKGALCLEVANKGDNAWDAQ